MGTHKPVLLNEVIDGLDIKPDGIYVDLTIGRGGHSKEILKRLTKNGFLLGIDQDDEAIKESKENLQLIGSNFKIVKSNFSRFDEVLNEEKIDKIDGALMDLGVSSPQFDEKERGFSYREDEILDMRMNQEQTFDAKQLVNSYSLNELTRVLRDYGDEKYAYQIAKNIIKRREVKPIETTGELVEIIKTSKPMKELAKKGHPAKQAFQAIRIEVNDELNVLSKTIPQVLSHLKSGGRLAIITFHSGEDVIVKKAFKDVTVVEGTRHNVFSLPSKEDEPDFILVNKKVIIASKEELEENRRATSAKLRIIQKL